MPALDSGMGNARFTPGAILVDRFRITAYVGRGGMGEIYRAEDLKLGQTVALKFISRERPSNVALRFFYDEVRLGRQIAHPSVCRVYDLLEVDGRPFIVMEFVEGEDLASLLGRIERLPYRKALEVARDICWGLDAAHERGIVHGDLKPANIMIDGRGRARITDLGLASLVGKGHGSGKAFGGTIAYMAPEQYTNLGAIRATDIYSLGLVLYEIFTGKRAREVAKLEHLAKASATPPERPSVHQPRIAPEVERILLRCLSVDPQERPDSVRAILAVLGGGDAVDAMILAGETPTPEYVAAIRKVEPLTAYRAWNIFAASLLCVAIILVLSSRLTLDARAELVKSPASLAAHARELAIRYGSAAPIRDQGYWFEPNLQYLQTHIAELARGGAIDTKQVPPIVFHYRSSQAPLAPLGASGRLTADDPPLNAPGMVHVALGPTGRLLRLQSYAAQSNEQPPAPADWSALLREAGINRPRFSPTSTTWTPSAPHDSIREWHFDGVLVRAARYRGHVSDFELLDPLAGAAEESPRRGRLTDLVYYIVLAVALIAGVFLARRNIQTRRVDRRGAVRVVVWIFVCRFMFGLVASHHPLVIEKEAAHLATMAGAALLLAAEVSLAYVALEPYVRRRWPTLMIGWMRFGQGRFHDAIVGRDILIGTLAGLLVRLLDLARNLLPSIIPSIGVIPSHLAVQGLESMRYTVGAIFYYHARAIFYALFALFVLLLLQMIMRIESLAAIAWVAAATMIWSRWDDPRVGLPLVAIQMTIFLLTMKRFGLLAMIAAVFANFLTAAFPLTTDFTRFYFGYSLLPLAIIVALIILGFRSAIAGRRFSLPILSARRNDPHRILHS